MADFSSPTKSEDDMSVISTASNVSIPADTIIAKLERAVEAGVLKKGAFVHMAGQSGGFYSVDARVKQVIFPFY